MSYAVQLCYGILKSHY